MGGKPVDMFGVKHFRSLGAWACGALLWLFITSTVFSATPETLCPICGNRLGTSAFLLTKRGHEEKVTVCADCGKLETTCYICGLPVKNKAMRLADGRLLCSDDAKQAVLTQDEAQKIFDDIKRDIQSMLSRHGVLPHHNIHLVLEAKARLDKTGGNLISAHDDRMLMGLTRSTSDESGKFEHTVSLLYGLTRERLMAVAAHEYGHAWLHENVRRKLNQDAVEGFCEWIAYKVIVQRNAPYETKVLLESDYSQGQLQAFIAAEKEHAFYRLIQWVKSGVDPELDREHLERILVLREGNSEPAPALAFAPITPRAPMTNLVLKGLSGGKARRFALINDSTLTVNEQAKVRLGESNVVVHCLEIGSDSAIIQVAGESERRTLRLIEW
jgi:hypothetical protein